MRLPTIFVITAAVAGCTESSFFVQKGTPEAGLSPGEVMGRVCDPSGRTWLADALVYTHLFTNDGYLYDTLTAYTDRDGYWYIEDLPPEHEYTFYVQYGDQVLETPTTWVGDDEFVKLEEPDCFDPLQLDVAVITGDYDDFQLVLNNMGFANYQLIDGLVDTDLSDFLLDLDAMMQYDIIFFNGGHIEEDIVYDTDGSEDSYPDGEKPYQIIQSNIKSYVEAGGAVYGSDWAYDVIEQCWPDRVEFVGDDTVPDDAQVGEYDLVNAAVSDAALADWLGENYVDIEYDLPVWAPIESTAGSVTEHLSGNVSYREGQNEYALASVPLLVSFTSGEGKVVYSTFRVAKNGTTDMMLVLQYMMYNL